MLSAKIVVLYDMDCWQYNVITKFKPAMAKKYMLKRVTLYMTLHTNVTKHAPCVQLRHTVLNIRPSTVVGAIGGFLPRSAFRII